jgi:fructose-1,6-bisphosphatase/sedoheptulose 1,7-bisphosphatase-like protein
MSISGDSGLFIGLCLVIDWCAHLCSKCHVVKHRDSCVVCRFSMASVVCDVAVHIADAELTVLVFDLTVSSDSELVISPATWRRLDEVVAEHIRQNGGQRMETHTHSAVESSTLTETVSSQVHIVYGVGGGGTVAPAAPARAPGRRKRKRARFRNK